MVLSLSCGCNRFIRLTRLTSSASTNRGGYQHQIRRRLPVPAAIARHRHFFSSTQTILNQPDPICELASSNLRYGASSTSEIGYDLAYMKANRILLFVDPHIRKMDPFTTVVESIEQHCNTSQKVQVDVYDEIRVEPNNVSFQNAIEYMTNQTLEHGKYDVVVALGGGSTIDTAKATNLYTCHPPSDFYEYVNPPLGKGSPVPGSLLPLIAIPTTAGTGSETTGVAIFDDIPTKSKTGIASRLLKPTLGIVDPDNVKSNHNQLLDTQVWMYYAMH